MKVYKNVDVTVKSDKAAKAAQMIAEAAKSGKFFSVVFIKKDGSIREMNCRMGVEKHLKGGVKTLTDNYICVYDVKSEGYRSVDPEKVVSVNGVSL
jgi:hypothetical protein